MTIEEQKYLDAVIEYFGFYSGFVLREMTHMTDPWIDARDGLSIGEISNRIISLDDMNKYFDKVYDKYEMKEILDIKKYSEDLFKTAEARLFYFEKK